MDANKDGHGAAAGPGTKNVHGVAAEPDVVPTSVPVSLYAMLAIAAVAAAVLVFVLFRAFERSAEKTDRAAIAEAGLERPPDTLPPAPRLQIHAVANWKAYRGAELERLETYGWMDRTSGAVHVPVDRAMELVLQRGVGPLPPAAVAMPAAPPAPGAAEGKP